MKCDVWSFGVLVYTLFYSAIPWDNCNSQQMIINKAYSPIKFNPNIDVPPEVIELIQNTIKIKEEDRFDAAEVFKWCENIYAKYIGNT